MTTPKYLEKWWETGSVKLPPPAMTFITKDDQEVGVFNYRHFHDLAEAHLKGFPFKPWAFANICTQNRVEKIHVMSDNRIRFVFSKEAKPFNVAVVLMVLKPTKVFGGGWVVDLVW